MKSALITGITGQDGAYLAQLLLDKGYKVYGTYRRLSTPNFWRLQYLGIFENVNLISADLIDSSSLHEAIQIAMPDEFYHLAAQSFVGASFEQPLSTANITGLGVARALEAVRMYKKMRFYQASTSELYGAAIEPIQSEETAFSPRSPYAAAKLYGYWMTRIYREAYGTYACNGILFNHESPLRGLEFVTRKITNSVAKIKLGLEKCLILGNLDAKRDWGYAPEYVEAMWRILQQEKPDDYVIATQETHTVREFVEKAFAAVGLDWQKYVEIDKRLFRPLEVERLCGDITKTRAALNWTPKTTFDGLVDLMVKEDLERWTRWQNKESFPWDAPAYLGQAQMIPRRGVLD